MVPRVLFGIDLPMLMFEEINRLSREVLIKTKDIVQALGFELVYADTDSVFLKKSSAALEDLI
jgi:DNA polymerase elongation subunit (family B)